MTQLSDSGGTVDSAVLASASAFDRLIETHAAAARAYRRAMWLLLGSGVVLVAIGLLGGMPWLFGSGIVVALSALVAWKKATEHAERCEGMAVLKEEWVELAPHGAADRLRALVRDLYGGVSSDPRPQLTTESA